jgi:hypothetical protein
MIAFLATLLRFILHALGSKRDVLSKNALLKKENEILLRRLGKKRVQFDVYDKLFLVVLHRAARRGDLFHLTSEVRIFRSEKRLPLSEHT